MNWFVVQVMSGWEKKVKKSIEEHVSGTSLKDFIEQIVVPTEKVAEVKKGEQTVREKSLWPGYIFIKMQLEDEVWHFLKEVNGVIGFLGGGHPQPLSEAEMQEILSDLSSKKDEIVHKYNINLGDEVKITDGVFVNFTGTVTEIFRDKGRLSVLVSIFGRDTRVDDLEFWQVEPVVADK